MERLSRMLQAAQGMGQGGGGPAQVRADVVPTAAEGALHTITTIWT